MKARSLHTCSEDRDHELRLVTFKTAAGVAWRLAASVLLFCLVFALIMASDWPAIATKDLYAWDESVNSTVTANLTRRVFPPMVRVNPLLDRQGNWMEGPYWQHIPPMFVYVPLPLFVIDGRVTVEMKRLAYALVLLISGIGFIVAVSSFEPSWLANASATLATILWISTPFTRASSRRLISAPPMWSWQVLSYSASG